MKEKMERKGEEQGSQRKLEALVKRLLRVNRGLSVPQ